MIKRVGLSLLFLLISTIFFAQKINFSLGRNQTTYHLINNSGNEIDFLQSASGNHLQATFIQPLLDTLNLQAKSAEKALKFSNKPLLSKILSQFTYSAGIQMSQLNAVGNIQQIALIYNTDYVGATVGVGILLPLYKRLSIHAETQIIANKLLHGQQQTASTFYTLTGNPQFNGIKFFKGYKIALTGKINSSTDLFISYSHQSSISPSESLTGNLTMDSQSIAIGLSLAIN